MMELTIMVARDLGMLPVQVTHRDEEIMYPGTFEYLHRVAQRTDEVDFHWIIAGQAIHNAYDRFNPYWWVFDPDEQERWVRGYPGNGEPQLPGRDAYWIPEQWIGDISGFKVFPLAGYRGWEDWDQLTWVERLRKAKKNAWPYNPDVAQLVSLVGTRTEESRGRYLAVLSMAGWRTGIGAAGNITAYPIFDWTTPDVWKFMFDYGLDYNEAYDTMNRYGMKAGAMRIAPPTFGEGASQLKMASQAWPQWWDRVCNRVGGLRRAAQFGSIAIAPRKNPGQTWEQVYRDELLNPEVVPDWIRERAEIVLETVMRVHRRKSSGPLPEEASCPTCQPQMDSWKALVHTMWDGDPFSKKALMLPYMEPGYFKEGRGIWWESETQKEKNATTT
jgi:predicted phosphoadenosine phosphosulfate sulfurtransferase